MFHNQSTYVIKLPLQGGSWINQIPIQMILKRQLTSFATTKIPGSSQLEPSTWWENALLHAFKGTIHRWKNSHCHHHRKLLANLH